MICHDISDHFPSLTIIKHIKCSKIEPLTITSRKLTDKNVNKIKEQLVSQDWKELTIANSVSDNFALFHNKLIETVNHIAPEREYTVPSKQVIHEPWMNNSLLKCCT